MEKGKTLNKGVIWNRESFLLWLSVIRGLTHVQMWLYTQTHTVFVPWLDFRMCTEISSKNFLQTDHLLVHREKAAKNTGLWYKGSTSQTFLQTAFLPSKCHEVKTSLTTTNNHSYWMLSAILISSLSDNVKTEGFPWYFPLPLSIHI